MPVPSLKREQEAWAASRVLIGVDEVGRGPLAGPVVAAAVVFPPRLRRVRGVRDSKVLSHRQREALIPRLRATALAIGVGAASIREIDRFNIRVATAIAMRRALARVRAALGTMEAVVLIDGLPFPEVGCEHEALVDGDARCYSIAAAGVLAKEIRDRLMGNLARRHPGYGWEQNAGYATEQHRAAINALGPTKHHRFSFAPVAQIGLDLGL
ncbi:MAG TPA: ribonuclease HII [Gemmatimonadales bacterium]|nr:ribonuclease HII [Gemmatimonadales bacterium]